MNTVFTIIISLAIFGALIVAHELGHFTAARACSIDVEEFSIGMGPLLWQKKAPRTKYSLRLFPIGGFCLMRGEDEADETPLPGSINAASPFKRIIVFGAGAFMNFLSAVLIFFAALCITGTDASTTIESVEAGSPADLAGIKAGSSIVQYEGSPVNEWQDFYEGVSASLGKTITIRVSEGGKERDVELTPVYSEEAGRYRVGVVSKSKFVFTHAVTRSFQAIGQYIVAIIGIFGGVFSGKFAFSEAFAGPIGVTVEIGKQISGGLLPVLFIAGAISVSLGFFNILPLPALDGSRIAFALIEMLKGSPVSRKWEGTIHYVGFILLLLFAAVVAFSDITKLI